MGYHITLSRPESGEGITAQEWKTFVASRPELKLIHEDTHFITAVLDGDERMALHYSVSRGSVFVNNPEGPRIIEYLASMAPHFGGVVTGDEGETFSSVADWGTQHEWDRRSLDAPRPWWRKEIPRGWRVILGLLFGALIVIIRQIYFTH